MSTELAFKLIDQLAEQKVPSVKFNWRGEPLLNPQLPSILDYAKRRGILETIINTNATKLDEKMSEEIINSGLDIMIYSFDGGTKDIYEKMRPGRFGKNSFDVIYKNIKNFSRIRNKLKSKFPRTNVYLTYNKLSDGDQRKKYFTRKRRELPPDNERGNNFKDSPLHDYK